MEWDPDISIFLGSLSDSNVQLIKNYRNRIYELQEGKDIFKLKDRFIPLESSEVIFNIVKSYFEKNEQIENTQGLFTSTVQTKEFYEALNLVQVYVLL